MSMVDDERRDKKNVIDSMYAEIERRSDEKNKNLLDKITTMKEREVQMGFNLEEKENKIDALEKKYKLSATKGIEYENDIYANLCDVNEKEYDSIWAITHIGHRKGHKGDIIAKHKFTNIQIMLDPKNHDIVEKKDKAKFSDDMRNPLNNYHAGIMLSRGKIRGKRSYESNNDGSKKLVYMSNYRVGYESTLLAEMEKIHDEIQKKSSDQVNVKTMREKYLKEYDHLQKQLNYVNTQMKSLKERENEITSEYNDYFESDISTDSMKKIDSITDVSDLIYSFLDKHIIKDDRLSVSMSEIKEEICANISNIKQKRITQCINTWKKRKFKDVKNATSKSVLKGYGLKDKNIVFCVETR